MEYSSWCDWHSLRANKVAANSARFIMFCVPRPLHFQLKFWPANLPVYTRLYGWTKARQVSSATLGLYDVLQTVQQFVGLYNNTVI